MRIMSNKIEQPYIKERVQKTIYKYNPKYGDEKMCQCGHLYYRHFDSYDNNKPVGCKYCDCFRFKPVKIERG